MSLKFTGDETLHQVLERLLSNPEALHGKELRITTFSGSFRGQFAGKGANFVLLRADTGYRVNAEPDKQVINHTLILTSTITAISFERLEVKKTEGEA